MDAAEAEALLEQVLDEGLDGQSPHIRELIPHIASSEESIHRILMLLGSRDVETLLKALAHHMGTGFVEHGLDHLRTAEGERASLLESILHEADPLWVREPAARRVLRNRLKSNSKSRTLLVVWLADAGNLGDFIDEIREHPPRCLEEWSSLGRTKVNEPLFVNRALSHLRETPDPIAYLLRLDAVPGSVFLRIMSAAKPDWLLSSLEVAIMEGLDTPLLLPLVELAARLGGRHLAAAVAWLNMARLGPRILQVLADQLRAAGNDRRQLNSMLWVQRQAPSANRALEQGRKGETPDPLDAAALVRQMQGGKMLELVREILEQPRPAMIESVLRPLCAVNETAAGEVVAICKSVNPELAQRAQELLAWPDVMWPEDEQAAKPPDTFTPLGRGI